MAPLVTGILYTAGGYVERGINAVRCAVKSVALARYTMTHPVRHVGGRGQREVSLLCR